MEKSGKILENCNADLENADVYYSVDYMDMLQVVTVCICGWGVINYCKLQGIDKRCPQPEFLTTAFYF